ncbi:class I SAM-dependent methyltransferase [Nocardia paucivorans]|uniref:class I SAM-dependent methyltransferase n=1 Tax=Nocardia paucivorans TaxID=114259 RepID=UPI00031D9C09|nr:class I SAM-dependent methyltransferase [Nocardia paucivorans]
MTPSVDNWNAIYDNDTAPWVIGEPQPAIVALERAGRIRGRVLDPGTGAGEHTIALTRLGYDVLGVDLSPSAVEYARRNAAEQGVPNARFEVADVLTLADDGPGRLGTFDTVVDSALFHIFGENPEARNTYVRGLHAVCAPGGYVHILALSDVEVGFGPRIGEHIIRDSFAGAEWELEELSPAHYRGRVTELVAEDAERLGLPTDRPVEAAAWLARIRRV